MYTREIFVIDRQVKFGEYYSGVPAYKLRDIQNNQLERGLFYENELNLVQQSTVL